MNNPHEKITTGTRKHGMFYSALPRFRGCFLKYFALLLILLPAAAHAQKSAYIFMVPLAGNVESKNMIAMLERVTDIAGKATGIKVDVEIPVYTPGEHVIDFIERGFKDGHSAFGYVHGNEYARYLDAGGDLIQPMFTLEMAGKVSTESCLYARKADGVSSLAGLEGKKWGGSSLIGTYVILNDAGIKTQPEKFFSEMVFVPDVNKANLIDTLLAGKIDVFPADTSTFNLALSTHEKKKEIARVKCADQYHNWIFVYRKGVPKEVVASVKKAFLRAHKDKAFQEFWWFLSAVKGKFVEFDPAKLKKTREIVKIEDKFGWGAKESKFQSANWMRYFKENKK